MSPSLEDLARELAWLRDRQTHIDALQGEQARDLQRLATLIAATLAEEDHRAYLNRDKLEGSGI